MRHTRTERETRARRHLSREESLFPTKQVALNLSSTRSYTAPEQLPHRRLLANTMASCLQFFEILSLANSPYLFYRSCHFIIGCLVHKAPE